MLIGALARKKLRVVYKFFSTNTVLLLLFDFREGKEVTFLQEHSSLLERSLLVRGRVQLA